MFIMNTRSRLINTTVTKSNWKEPDGIRRRSRSQNSIRSITSLNSVLDHNSCEYPDISENAYERGEHSRNMEDEKTVRQVRRPARNTTTYKEWGAAKSQERISVQQKNRITAFQEVGYANLLYILVL